MYVWHTMQQDTLVIDQARGQDGWILAKERQSRGL